MKVLLLAHIKRMHEEDLEAQLQLRPTRRIGEATPFSYESANAAQQQMSGQLHEILEQMGAMSAVVPRPTVPFNANIKCHNCGTMGHVSRKCHLPRKQVERLENSEHQQNIGNKRAFNPTPMPAKQFASKRPYVSDPSKAKWPPQRTGQSVLRVHAAIQEPVDYGQNFEYSALHAQMLMDQQEIDETIGEEEEEGDEE